MERVNVVQSDAEVPDLTTTTIPSAKLQKTALIIGGITSCILAAGTMITTIISIIQALQSTCLVCLEGGGLFVCVCVWGRGGGSVCFQT